MTNNQLCNIIGAVGCIIASLGMGLVFFGVPLSAWVVIIGITIGIIGLVNYD